MIIHVEMTEVEYDKYRAYQKDKATLENEIADACDGIRERHDVLCALIKTAIDLDVITEYAEGVPYSKLTSLICNDRDALASAVKMANDWCS